MYVLIIFYDKIYRYNRQIYRTVRAANDSFGTRIVLLTAFGVLGGVSHCHGQLHEEIGVLCRQVDRLAIPLLILQ